MPRQGALLAITVEVIATNPAAESRRLLARAQAGERRALNELFRRELPLLRRWAHSRVPRGLWRRADADDLVQLTFLRALRRYGSFQSRSGPQFQHYLRRILINLTRDEIRKALREPDMTDADELIAIRQPTSLDLMLGRDAIRRFRRALDSLPPRSKRALQARLEMGRSYADIARLIQAPNAEAARSVVTRAVERVARLMKK